MKRLSSRRLSGRSSGAGSAASSGAQASEGDDAAALSAAQPSLWRSFGDAVRQRIASLLNPPSAPSPEREAEDPDTDADTDEEEARAEGFGNGDWRLRRRASVDASANAHGTLELRVDDVLGVPLQHARIEKRNFIKSGYFVTVSIDRLALSLSTATAKNDDDGDVHVGDTLTFQDVGPADTLVFTVMVKLLEGSLGEGFNVPLGEVRVVVADLVREALAPPDALAFAALWLRDAGSDTVVFDAAAVTPTRLCVRLDHSRLPPAAFGAPRPEPSEAQAAELAARETAERAQFAKHVFMCTRGTRGDVQPFIALGRGLAEHHNFCVTICTEDRYRPLVEHYSGVSRGRLQFRPSGGDTEKRISTAVARWALRQNSTALQLAMLGRSEREFFDSEPLFHLWCRALAPDAIVFGFTTANVAMVLSESLGIPLIGFLLQPTVIPSKQYPAIALIDSDGDADLSHRIHGRIKMFMENNPLDFNTMLNDMRARRGLQPYSHRVNNFTLLVQQDVPLVVPINKTVFGGKPPDWHARAELTDFIFLRTGAVPNLSPRFVKFVMDARAAKQPIVVMAFSSMPVPRARILELCLLILRESRFSPRIIALVGAQNALRTETPALGNSPKGDALRRVSVRANQLEDAAAKLSREGRLLVAAGAPFGRLFPRVDLVIAHGGLGTTGEILRAGKPTITTGVLILDQRYWGRRVHELGCGPPPTHVRDFHTVAVAHVDACLAPDSAFAARARELAGELAGETGAAASGGRSSSGAAQQQQQLLGEDDADGVAENADAVVRAMEDAQPMRPHRESIMRSPRRLASAMAADTNRAVADEARLVRGLISSVAVQNAREIRAVVQAFVRDRDNT